MALGETILTLGMEPEEGLGSACIVGSAAFNLLAISSVCVMAIDKGDVRRIADYGVFVITATFSIWAYRWMYIVMKVTSPKVIDLSEALPSRLQFYSSFSALGRIRSGSGAERSIASPSLWASSRMIKIIVAAGRSRPSG